MNRPKIIVIFGIFVFAGARSLGAQQVNPRVPPPPPAAAAPTAPPDATPPAPSTPPPPPPPPPPAIPKPIDPTVPPLPPSEDSTPDVAEAPSGPVFDPLHAQRSL